MDTWELPSFEENKPQKRERSRWAEQLKRENRDDAANRKEMDVASIKQKQLAMEKSWGGQAEN